MRKKPVLFVLKIHSYSIFQQLQIEEFLLQKDEKNWLLLNGGTSPAIVMGFSAKSEKAINWDLFEKEPVSLIRRFSGGGTVYVDENTLFVSLILNKRALFIPSFPQAILNWTEEIYSPLFKGLDFRIEENDYVLGDRKFGGNAQHISRFRFLHHSTLLWDFNPDKMDYLRIPPTSPTYRRERGHRDFLCHLSSHFSNRERIFEEFCRSLSRSFELEIIPWDAFVKNFNGPLPTSRIFLERPLKKAAEGG